jgi:hypothetical protein
MENGNGDGIQILLIKRIMISIRSLVKKEIKNEGILEAEGCALE